MVIRTGVVVGTGELPCRSEGGECSEGDNPAGRVEHTHAHARTHARTPPQETPPSATSA